MRFLLVEDDAPCMEILDLMLRSEKHITERTETGDEAIDLAKVYDFDAIVLDMTLPDMSGFDVLRRLRDAKVDTPVLVLTALADIEDKVRAFDLGADDFVTKPYHRDELLARLKAIVRRSQGHAASVVTAGDLAVNLTSKTITVADKPVHLTGKEFAMLELLALRKGATITKEAFLDNIYQGRDEPELKIIDVFICKLRRKLSDASGGKNYIETVWGRGVRLADPSPMPPVIANSRLRFAVSDAAVPA